MRYGFTTGSCSAAAAKAAAIMLISGNRKESIIITTPKGIDFNAEIVDIQMSADKVRCGIVKDGGDDPDITTGATVYAEVQVLNDNRGEVIIDGGLGVGRITKPGLDQPVGSAAINSVPRKMIEEEVRQVMRLYDFNQSLKVVISVPDGVEIGQKTFNPRLGIEGGISILGTSGIVEPMSRKALLDTIYVELKQKKALGFDSVVIAPGNYGLDFMKKEYGFDLDKAVKCSNFIGDTLDMIGDLGFKQTLLCGHIGKLIKVSGGIMNTHSKEADCRMELMTSAALEAGAEVTLLKSIMTCVTTDAAYDLIKEASLEKKTMSVVMDRIKMQLQKRAAGRFETECIVFSNAQGLLGETSAARKMLEEL